MMRSKKTGDSARPDIRRRLVLQAMALLPVTTLPAYGEEVIDLTWQDLLPEGQAPAMSFLGDLVDHDSAPMSSLQPESIGVRSEWNGKTVRLPGFMIPLDFDGTGVTAFILAPFVGACVHVPPPPANQLVFVTSETPFQSAGLFEPVEVTGMFGISSMSTQLAEIGYALSADKIERY